MQTSGTAPNFSDGMKKVITTAPPAKAPAVKVAAPKPSGHRRGGFQKHAKGK